MTYEEFKNEICQRIRQLLSPDAFVQLQQIPKNNGLVLDGLTISTSQSNISPTIFLNYYYERQDVFPDFEAICRDILLTYEHNKTTESLDLDFFTDYDLVKDFLAYRVINYDKNKDLLSTIPHIKYLDLAIVFYCLLKISDRGNATILIHNSHLKLWHVTADDLMQLTSHSTPLLLPYDFRNVSLILSDTFNDNSLSVPDPDCAADSFCPMYILTNFHKLYGASCILYPNLLANISQKMNSDLFILPSSIHEVIILPAANRIYYTEFADMVAEINQKELAADEVLSMHVYFYSKSKQTLSICSTVNETSSDNSQNSI